MNCGVGNDEKEESGGHFVNPRPMGFLKNCHEIKSSRLSIENGVYFIDPDGPGNNQPIEVICNMTNGSFIHLFNSNSIE